ncbi:hypothetical protein Bca101_020898 [Brassica carinata]
MVSELFLRSSVSGFVADINAARRESWNPSPNYSFILSLSLSWSACEFVFTIFGIFLERHPILLPPLTGFTASIERIWELSVQQWPQFDRDRIFRNIPRILAGELVFWLPAAWEGGGVEANDHSGDRGRGLLPPLCPPSLVPSQNMARSPLVRNGGVRRVIPAYSDILNSTVDDSSLRGRDRDVAKSSPFNCDIESERAIGESSGIGLTAPGGGESFRNKDGVPSPVALATGFMEDVIRSSVRPGSRPSEDALVEEFLGQKRSRKNPYARVFCYNGNTPFVNDERACVEYFFCARNAAINIPDVDDLVHAQDFKDMARSSAQARAHTVRVVHHYERDLKRARGKLEDMFAEKELRDDKIRKLEALVKDLTYVVENTASKAESPQAELSALSNREAILRSQIGYQKNSLGARIDYLEWSREDYAAKEVARAVWEASTKYWGRL